MFVFFTLYIGYREDYIQEEMDEWLKKIGLFEPDIKLLVGESSMNVLLAIEIII